MSIANLASALSKAQAKFPKVKFDAKNPFLKNKYATLGALIEAAKPVLSEFGLAVVQLPTSQSNMVGVRTILMHESGESVEDTMYLLPENAKGLSINQSAGVSITYMRRYAFASVLGLYADEDTDGDAVGNLSGEAHDQATAIMKPRKWSSEQTEAMSVTALDSGLEPMTAEDAAEVLNFSVLPENAPVKTVQSWFGRYLKSEGASPIEKANDANVAYVEAKKSKKS